GRDRARRLHRLGGAARAHPRARRSRTGLPSAHGRNGGHPMRLLNAELFKLRTTAIWWIMGIILIPLYAASVGFNWLSSYALTTGQADGGASDAQAQVDAVSQPINIATNLYTTGQYMGVLIVLLLSAIIVTSEFFHLTATTTFLVTPRREAVILAKFGAAIIVSLIVWALTTLLNLLIVPIVMDALNLGSQIGE